jgi:hypothetical protein
MKSRLRKFALVAMLALVAVGAMQGAASAAADGDLDISTMPPRAQWRINPAVVAAQPGSIQVQTDVIKALAG